MIDARVVATGTVHSDMINGREPAAGAGGLRAATATKIFKKRQDNKWYYRIIVLTLLMHDRICL